MLQSDALPGRPDPIRAAKVVTALESFLPKALSDQVPAAPKHTRLHNALLEAIACGVVVEGDKLPSENELTSIAPFSLGTVQRAMKSLMDEGVVMRKTGVGTIVRSTDQSMKQPLHCRFAGPDGVFLPVYPKMLHRQAAEPGGHWADVLNPDRRVLRLDRRIEIGTAFAVKSHFYVDSERFPQFAKRPFADLHTENFKRLMQAEVNVRVSSLDHKLTFVPAPDDVAGHIGVVAGAQVLLIRVVAQDGADAAIYYQELFIPPNDYELTIESRLSTAAPH